MFIQIDPSKVSKKRLVKINFNVFLLMGFTFISASHHFKSNQKVTIKSLKAWLYRHIDLFQKLSLWLNV